MALFALADLHLGEAVDKPMDIFGAAWTRHPDQIQTAWRELVGSEDTVLIPGDISWAMSLEDARPDLDWIAALPGRKILLRGNHDYWWSSIGRLRQTLDASVTALQNDAFAVEQWAVCGSRGWLLPSHPKFTAADDVVYRREAQRLRMSLDAAARLGTPKVAMMHYPPTDYSATDTLYTDLLEAYEVKLCVYGHLHGAASRFAFTGEKGGVRYQLVSSDYLGFRPARLSTEGVAGEE